MAFKVDQLQPSRQPHHALTDITVDLGAKIERGNYINRAFGIDDKIQSLSIKDRQTEDFT